MDDAVHRKLSGSSMPSGEADGDSEGLSSLADQMSGGLAGLNLLLDSGWQAPSRSEEKQDEDKGDSATELDLPARAAARPWLIVLAVFAVALAARLIFLYLATDPDVLIPSWSNDTWHRWQIAYLSGEIGLHQSPPRLWDLKGLEYFWGVVHPLISSALFSITGSVDVMILRWMTMIAGAANIVLLYLIANRFWGRDVAIATALIASLNPIVVFNDSSGMVEPISFVLLLAGIYLFGRRSFLAGLLWGFAAMTRAEAWLMSGGLVFAAMLARERSQHKLGSAVGWAIPVAVYMKHLFDVTGNAIYPIYWNFLANAAGRWEFREGFTDYQLAARPILGLIFLAAVLGAGWTLWKRPRGHLILLLGGGTTAFISGFIGLTAYLKSYEPWFWMTRFFVFPYLFLGLLFAVLAFHVLPSRSDAWRDSRKPWGALAVAVILMQLAWIPISVDIEPGYTSQTVGRRQEQQGQEIAQWYSGGKILIPENEPQLTYAIGRYAGIGGANILGQMYGPDYYFGGDEPLEHWEELEPLMLDWIRGENVRLLLVGQYNPIYLKLVEENPDHFSPVGKVPHKAISMYLVNR